MKRSDEGQRPGRLAIRQVAGATRAHGEIAEEVETYHLKGRCFESHRPTGPNQFRGRDAGFLQHATGHRKELVHIGALGLRHRKILHNKVHCLPSSTRRSQCGLGHDSTEVTLHLAPSFSDLVVEHQPVPGLGELLNGDHCSVSLHVPSAKRSTVRGLPVQGAEVPALDLLADLLQDGVDREVPCDGLHRYKAGS